MSVKSVITSEHRVSVSYISEWSQCSEHVRVCVCGYTEETDSSCYNLDFTEEILISQAAVV